MKGRIVNSGVFDNVLMIKEINNRQTGLILYSRSISPRNEEIDNIRVFDLNTDRVSFTNYALTTYVPVYLWTLTELTDLCRG